MWRPGSGPPEEERMDPDDGGTYTLRRLKEAFKDQYSEEDIEAYWRVAMRPVRRRPPEVRLEALLADAPEVDYNERRFVPDCNDEVWAFGRFQERYGAECTPAELRAYWLEVCTPDERERRVDPEDGAEVTFAELEARHGEEFGRRYLGVYWRVFCKPADGGAGGPALAPLAELEERREDPADRQRCTFRELREKYSGRYNVGYLRNYWRMACRR